MEEARIRLFLCDIFFPFKILHLHLLVVLRLVFYLSFGLNLMRDVFRLSFCRHLAYNIYTTWKDSEEAIARSMVSTFSRDKEEGRHWAACFDFLCFIFCYCIYYPNLGIGGACLAGKAISS